MIQRRLAGRSDQTIAAEAASKAINNTVSQIARAMRMQTPPGDTPSERRDNLIRMLLSQFRRRP